MFRRLEEDYYPYSSFSIMPDHLENINHAASEQGNVSEIGRVLEEDYYTYSTFSIMPDNIENINHAASYRVPYMILIFIVNSIWAGWVVAC